MQLPFFYKKKVKNESADYFIWILRVRRTEHKYFQGIYDEINLQWSGT